MKPMLAKTYGPKYPHFPCILQPKLNGVRALAQLANGAVVMQSRDEKLWRPEVLGHLYDELKTFFSLFVGGPPPILDGEIYVHGWRLQDINSACAVNRKEKTDKTPELEYHIFDVIPNLTTSFLDRWIAIYADPRFRQFRHIKIVPTHACDNREVMDQWFKQYTAIGYEGVMLRRDLPYELGETSHGTQYRSPSLWKHKQWEDGEFTCIEVTPGEGKASIGVGALILHRDKIETSFGTVETNHVLCHENHFKVGTGLSDADRVAFASSPPIGKLVRVRYLELTEAGIPFNPSFLAVL